MNTLFGITNPYPRECLVTILCGVRALAAALLTTLAETCPNFVGLAYLQRNEIGQRDVSLDTI